MKNVFDAMLAPYDEERTVFGENWCGPTQYDMWQETLVARYDGRGDGQTVEVYCTAAPARFYTLKALAGTDSAGGNLRPFELGTGSGMAALVAKVAKAISGGMLGFHAEEAAR